MIDTDEDYDALAASDELALRAISRPTFQCKDCGSEGSATWMNQHNCAHNQYVNDNGGRCEDYPCCGHTDGDGCRTLESHTSDYWAQRMTDMRDQGYDDYEIDVMFSREEY